VTATSELVISPHLKSGPTRVFPDALETPRQPSSSSFPRLSGLQHVSSTPLTLRPLTRHRLLSTFPGDLKRAGYRHFLPDFITYPSNMSDIDDELFALAGGDEENDVEEGEA
jgi:hypothetical protein